MTSIKVHHLIIHELQKEPGSADVQLYLSEEQVPIDEKAERLIEKLNETFIHKESILNGYFDETENVSFPSLFRNFTENGFREDGFIRFSKDTVDLLRIGIQGVVAAKGGYLVYTDYEYLGDRFVGVFLVRDTDGLVFRKDSEHHSFLLNTVTYLNTEKLAMACLVDLAKFEDDTGRYLQIIKYAKTQREISEYFLFWLSIERPESSREFTQTFLQLIDELPLPKDAETGLPVDEDAFRKEAYAFAASNPHKTINIRDFDAHFYGENRTVQQFMEERDVTLDTEFRFDQKLLKQLYKFNVRAEGISLGFSIGDYKTRKITVQGSMVMIDSQALADKITELFPDE